MRRRNAYSDDAWTLTCRCVCIVHVLYDVEGQLLRGSRLESSRYLTGYG